MKAIIGSEEGKLVVRRNSRSDDNHDDSSSQEAEKEVVAVRFHQQHRIKDPIQTIASTSQHKSNKISPSNSNSSLRGVGAYRDNYNNNNNSNMSIIIHRTRNLNGLDNPLDISLLTISIALVLSLVGVVSWFCYQKRKLKRQVNDVKLKGKGDGAYPEITIVRSRMSGSDDSSNTQQETMSDVSSIWDSASQRFDKTYLEHRELHAQKIEDTQKILISNSKEFNQSQQWSEIERQQMSDMERNAFGSDRDDNLRKINSSASI